MNKEKGEETDRLRVFLAIEIPDAVRARIAEHTGYLSGSEFEKIRWIRPENLHITLKFLGDIEAEQTIDLARAVARSTQKVAPFELRISGTGCFPPRGLTRVLWLGLAGATHQLALLQQSLEDEAAKEGFEREERPFRPHLTIARPNSLYPAQARSLAKLHGETDFKSEVFPVAEVVVMQSELSPQGSRYSVLSRHKLGTK